MKEGLDDINNGRDYLKGVIWFLGIFSLVLALYTNISFLSGILVAGLYVGLGGLSYSGRKWAIWVLGIILLIRSANTFSNVRNSLELMIAIVYGLLGLLLLLSKNIKTFVDYQAKRQHKSTKEKGKRPR